MVTPFNSLGMRKYSNSRGISLLSVVGKVYGRILINRIRGMTDSVLIDRGPEILSRLENEVS